MQKRLTWKRYVFMTLLQQARACNISFTLLNHSHTLTITCLKMACIFVQWPLPYLLDSLLGSTISPYSRLKSITPSPDTGRQWFRYTPGRIEPMNQTCLFLKATWRWQLKAPVILVKSIGTHFNIQNMFMGSQLTTSHCTVVWKQEIYNCMCLGYFALTTCIGPI